MTVKFSILTGILLITALTANGQLRFGLNAGFNLSSLSSETTDVDRWETGMGFRIGGFSEKAFGKFGVHLELDYSYVKVKGYFDDKVALSYASVPVTIFYRPIKQLKILVGPEFNFHLGQRGPTYQPSFGGEDFEKVDYGLHVEIEILALKKLGVFVRNYFGLNYNSELPDHGVSILGGVSMNRFNIFGLTLNYYLGEEE